MGCLGTETDGSITAPSSFNNVVGIKPSKFMAACLPSSCPTNETIAVGLTSRHLVIPISEHQDTVGPIARTVKDAAYILQAIAGVDSYDNYTSSIPGGVVPDYMAACNLSTLAGSRIGVPRNVMPLFYNERTRPIVESFEQALGVLQAAGATIVEDTNFTAAVEFWNSTLWQKVVNADFVAGLQNYLGSLNYNPRNVTSLSDIRQFTKSFPLEDYPDRTVDAWDQALLQGWNNADLRFWPAYEQNLYYGKEGGLLGAIERHSLDAVILPANFASHWAASVGAPIVTVPLGSYPIGEPVVRNSWGLVQSAPNIP